MQLVHYSNYCTKIFYNKLFLLKQQSTFLKASSCFLFFVLLLFSKRIIFSNGAWCWSCMLLMVVISLSVVLTWWKALIFFRKNSPIITIRIRTNATAKKMKYFEAGSQSSSAKPSQRSSWPSQGTEQIHLPVYRCLQGNVAAESFSGGYPMVRGQVLQRLSSSSEPSEQWRYPSQIKSWWMQVKLSVHQCISVLSHSPGQA